MAGAAAGVTLTLVPTAHIAEMNGVKTRRWEGTDEHGVSVVAYIAAVSPQTHDETVAARFAASLRELPQPAHFEVFDMRYFAD